MVVRSNSAAKSQDDGDAIYYRDGVTTPLAEWVMRHARRDVYDLFRREFTTTRETTILDIGVSLVETAESNALERLYPYQDKLTCAGLGDGEVVKRRYPNASYVRIEAGQRLPFADRQFDIAYSNAVLEHVGGRAERAQFLSEAIRVSKAVFFAIPNHWFPVEHHTGILLLHYLPSLFRSALKRGKKAYWSDSRNVDFLSKTSLRREFSAYSGLRMQYCGIRLGPFSSNVALMISRPE
jgi:hypothetical protein